MTNKKTLGLAIGQALIALAMATGSAQAAETAGKVDVDSLLGQEAFDRFLVKYAAGAAEATDAGTAERGLASAATRSGLTGARQTAASYVSAMGVPGWHVVQTSRRLSRREAEAFMRELAADPSVAHVAADEVYVLPHVEEASERPDDPRYGTNQWHFHDPLGGVNAEAAWDLANGDGVVVAVIDTGIVENHEDLQENVLPGYDFISSASNSRRPQAGRAPGGWDVGTWRSAGYCGAGTAARNSSWHGSHVAGTIAQTTDNGLRYAGLAHGARVVPVRVLGACGGSAQDIADGIIWASGGTVPEVPANEHPAEIINMSLGSVSRTTCPALYQDAIDTAVANGSIIVVAAGNDNDQAGLYTMSSCDKVISVGATRVTGGKAIYSSYGGRVDLSAPGGGGSVDGNPEGYIWQTINAGTQRPTAEWKGGGMTGTSMASPHVAAVAAMVQSVAETPLDWQQMRDLLVETSRPFPAFVSVDMSMGAGIVDAAAAVNRALGNARCDGQSDSCNPDAVVLTRNVSQAGVSVAKDERIVFEYTAEAGKALTFSTVGGTGDVSMYVGFEAVPTADEHAFASRRPGNREVVRIDARQVRAGTYYITLVGESDAANVLIEARQ